MGDIKKVEGQLVQIQSIIISTIPTYPFLHLPYIYHEVFGGRSGFRC